MSAAAPESPSLPPDVVVRQQRHALAAARRWQVLHSRWQHERRNSERLPFEEIATLVCGLSDEGEADHRVVAFKAWGYNISETGLCCVTNSQVLAFWPLERQSAFVPLRGLVRRGCRLTLGLPGPVGRPLWLDGEVARVRSVHDELFEMGLRFVARRGELPHDVARLLERAEMADEPSK
jgi:hypothetical protein